MRLRHNLPSIRHPSYSWGPAFSSGKRVASFRCHDGVGEGLDPLLTLEQLERTLA